MPECDCILQNAANLDFQSGNKGAWVKSLDTPQLMGSAVSDPAARVFSDGQNAHTRQESGEAAFSGSPAAIKRNARMPLALLSLRASAAHSSAATSRGRGLSKGRLGPENLHERLVGALLVGISAADANRAD